MTISLQTVLHSGNNHDNNMNSSFSNSYYVADLYLLTAYWLLTMSLNLGNTTLKSAIACDGRERTVPGRLRKWRNWWNGNSTQVGVFAVCLRTLRPPYVFTRGLFHQKTSNEAEKNSVDELLRSSLKRIKHNQPGSEHHILLRFQTSLSNTLATSQLWLFKFKLIKIK